MSDWNASGPSGPDHAGDHRELAELVDAARRLVSAAALADIAPADMRRATAQMRQVTDVLATAARSRCLRLPLPTGPVRGRVGGSADPVLGRFNPIAAPLVVTIDDEGVARGRLTPGALFEGPPGAVHGGYSAMVLDGVMGTLVRALGVIAMTGTLTLRYLAPTPLDRPLDLTARVVDRGGRKTTVEGWISADGRTTVHGNGTFVSPLTWPPNTTPRQPADRPTG
ncbi:PaaI family thioesterase [Micromonospora sp. NPDC050200]|uniref:PaaI family thioesterase n=1 Tax=Micromonospora sp. NPDC050200 TaxID=3155664 RepID=UPI0033CCC9BD